MKTNFRQIRLSADNKKKLSTINKIIGEYSNQGLILTLRQLYYQLVSRDVIPNNVKEYKKISKLLTEGRMAGVVDWSAIEDRLRKPSTPNSWATPQDALETIERVFALERQEGQDTYMEVWVEKDALSGVLERVTRPFHIPIMVNRGYSSVTAMYDAWNRFHVAYKRDQAIRVIYLGDFDPSGRDMIRDIEERICEFQVGANDGWNENEELAKTPELWREYCQTMYNFDFEIIPIALTSGQIKKHNPPPNPAKLTDTRAKEYITKYGYNSWEVDALPPNVLNTILTKAIEVFLDRKKFDEIVEQEQEHRDRIKGIRENYDSLSW